MAFYHSDDDISTSRMKSHEMTMTEELEDWQQQEQEQRARGLQVQGALERDRSRR